ncbi:hypothetical protein N8212_00615 [Pelagibacteraceae bacterium]|nr:hypothetical protein [Pelagibacteraceae bacterium]
MKKLLGIIVLGFLLGGNAYAEIITFTKCAIERNNYIFDTESYERYELRFDTTAKTVTKIVEYTDKYIKKYGELKHYVSESKLDYIVDHLAGRSSSHNGETLFKYVYDLEKKTYEAMDILANYQVNRFKCL